ncbi:SusD/RagB family nutrient-binding outer membrane lipoprotein [Hymenobacter terricola]|uniref:SusD/RagB family nutrient-binding outer membrane lipoprotein n=1 Tax=Hymenobacter terricola TaxID=2819236 RepID=UPI001B3187E4|nr:SusD/RagB family nutrient-binding outer membrane lipoprotein [Hymenobacter terricola]
MKFRKISAALALATTLVTAPGCKDFYDVNVNPLSPKSVGLYSLLPVTQVSMASDLGDNINGLSQYTQALMQQLYNPRSIGNFTQTGDSFINPWSDLYTTMLVNNEQIITQGTKEQHWDYVGIAQLQKAYVYSQMVDLWGDIPYSEALQGAVNTSPRFDKDSEIYNGSADGSIQGLFSLIDAGLANLAKPSISTKPALATVDLIYQGSLDNWGRFGRTLKLKLYNQLRKTNTNAVVRAQIAPLLSGNLMQEGSDFQLAYQNTLSPDNRNPGYVNDYAPSPENRIGRYFYEGMLTLNDPRLPYYFFNQVAQNAAPVTMQDYVSPLDPRFVTVRPGSTGQYVSVGTTASVQTVQGLYPIGGHFDNGAGGKTSPTLGQGVAPQRLLTYYSRKYTEAELQLVVLNDPTAAGVALEEAIKASFRKVNVIAAADGSPTIQDTLSTRTPRVPSIAAYATSAMARYNAAPNTEEKLEVIMYEKYVASFGYGVDTYTDFRRTGHPRIHVSQQAADPARGLLPDDGGTLSTGVFPRRLYYPATDLILNPNSPRTQKDPSTPIFWDR